MNDIEFKCPKCGNTDDFVADTLIMHGPVSVSRFGYEPMDDEDTRYELPDNTRLRCYECGHEGPIDTFRI